MYNLPNGTQSEVPPFTLIPVFPENSEEGGYIYSKLALDGLITAYCGTYPMQIEAAKWRILALLNQEYKNLSFKRQLLVLSSREDDPLWDIVIKRMVEVDKVAREYSLELTGQEL